MIKTAAVKSEGQQAHQLGRRWATLKRDIEKLETEIKGVSKRLIRAMRRSRKSKIEVGDDLIQIITQRQKRPSKGEIVGFFGKDRGEDFWETLPDRISEYLSFVKEKDLG